jgi:hypothetical protein
MLFDHTDAVVLAASDEVSRRMALSRPGFGATIRPPACPAQAAHVPPDKPP